MLLSSAWCASRSSSAGALVSAANACAVADTTLSRLLPVDAALDRLLSTVLHSAATSSDRSCCRTLTAAASDASCGVFCSANAAADSAANTCVGLPCACDSCTALRLTLASCCSSLTLATPPPLPAVPVRVTNGSMVSGSVKRVRAPAASLTYATSSAAVDADALSAGSRKRNVD